MRCRFAFEVQVNPATLPDMARPALIERDERSFLPAGTEFESNALVPLKKNGVTYRLPAPVFFVKQGMADPADEECRKLANLAPEQIAELQRRFLRMQKGILPDDFEAYDRGWIAGYDENGDYVAGPNYAEYEAQLEAEEEEELASA